MIFFTDGVQTRSDDEDPIGKDGPTPIRTLPGTVK